ncbi:macro domain-containing protein [Vibrio antiquarius]|uniref:macro domain-containing protein n=1 Tax=Vibrio antiquarius (strain Ex25) TaxID=150340 RepID=UPI00265C9ECD|nr:macro domain-containing protein [Vibrio antiquarius]MCR9686253.1 macro domain-containing protein [Vibrio antiquarius]
MKTVYGDIFHELEQNRADVLVHGCNCFCNMGAGIALTIKNRYPQALIADRKTEVGKMSKLGSYTKALAISSNNSTFTIINAYTQYHWKGSEVLADYEAIRKVFRAIKRDFGGSRIVYPLIGAGLAKGSWTIIKSIIDDELVGEEHYCVLLPEQKK